MSHRTEPPAEATTEAFLGGQPIDVDPASIERALAALWGPAAEDTAGEGSMGGSPPALTRLSLGSHIVIAPAAEAQEVCNIWDGVARSHPSRVLLILVGEDGPREVTAAIAAVCHLPAPGEPQVCAERIVMQIGADALPRLPGLVLPLLEADVPATLWWSLPALPPDVVVTGLATAVDRCLIDLTRSAAPAETYRALKPCAPTDVAWYRARAWQEAIAQLFDAATTRDEAYAVDRVEVTSAAFTQPGDFVPAALLAGWIAGQLGWQRDERIDEADAVYAARWRLADGQTAITCLRQVPVGDGRPGRLQAVDLRQTDTGAHWRVERRHDSPRELLAEAHHPAWCRLPSRIPAPRPDEAAIRITALKGSLSNASRERAVANAVWVLGWEG